MIHLRVQFLPALLLSCAGVVSGDDTTSDFFESKIRPVLIERCHSCHGSSKQSGGLRLDKHDSFLSGGHTGPVAVPGKPAESLIIKAIRHSGDYAMPPKEQLPEATIRYFEQWIKLGAPWPKPSQSNGVHNQQEAEANPHWAFQPVQRPTVPDLTARQQQTGTQTPVAAVDAFIQQRLREHNLERSPPADRRSLIRRVTYSLTGLPPTHDEVGAFMNDRQPDAYVRLVERLLASNHYGEHWARHWLDVSRYSDTKGYVYGREERFWPHAWAYRDWVVNALNEDLAYDRFLLLQLAADQIKDRTPGDLAAMGFLTLGRRFLGVRREIIDDRIDVVCRGMMGLTVSCARCHDHKFDPIPAADYYSLYGVFDSCMEHLVPLSVANDQHDSTNEHIDDTNNFQAELKKRQTALHATMVSRRAEADSRVRNRIADYLFAQSELDKYPANGFDQIFASDDLLPAVVRSWSRHLRKTSTQQDQVFVYWRHFAKLSADDFPHEATRATRQLNAQHGKSVNQRIAKKFETPPESLREVCDRYGEVFQQITTDWETKLKDANSAKKPIPTGFSDPDEESLRQLLYGPDSPCQMPIGSITDSETFFDSAVCTELWKLQGEVDRWIIQSKRNAPFALTLQDSPKPNEPRIFKRGDPLKLGRDVPRQFLSIVAGQKRKPFQNGSGRLELAHAIIDPTNPLTARVMVNRVWMHHFGKGLVSTPSDFGTRATLPSHPDLLDWLTSDFIDRGWSLKTLHRQILLSETYRQSSSGPKDAARLKQAFQTDPDNKRLWRFNPQRLGFEELRDSILLASGQLDPSTGGKPSPLFKKPYPTKRTLYGLVDRQYLPGTLRIFDFANPDLHVAKRSETTVPQQALFFMNHPWMLMQARELSEQNQVGPDGSVLDDRQRITKLFQMILQRDPTDNEHNESLDLITATKRKDAATESPTTKNWTYGYGEFDDQTGRSIHFTPLPHFTGTAWQGGSKFPDSNLGWVQLTSTGGHPGNDRQHAAIRRWTADREMSISIQSSLKHEPELGDGIRAFITSSCTGLHQSVNSHHNSQDINVAQIKVSRGDTVDFIVDIGDGLNNDQYLWSAVIQELGQNTAKSTWNSRTDFPAPVHETLDGWEQLAQVLLCSNEFMFVD